MAISTIDSNGLTNPLTSGVTTNTITSAASTALTLKSAGTTAVTIDTSQNVGIGTSSPSTKLSVVQNQNGASQVSISNNTGGASSQALFSATDGTNYGQFGMWGSGVSASGAQQPSNAYVYGSGGVSYFTGGTHRWYYNTNTEAMRINSSGYLLVGCTALPSSSVAGASLSPSVTSVNPHFFSAGSTTSSVAQINFINGNGTVGQISTSGSGTTYATSSDYRLKNTIAPMTGALAKVQALKPVTYKWNADNSDGEGFIAHELQSVVPEAVTGAKDAVDAEGNPVYQGIDTSFLVATLTAALQETKALIDQQAETINALTARIEALENK